MLRKMITIIFTILISIPVFAPAERCFYIERPKEIQPYEKIWQVICLLESSNDSLAYHMEDNGFASVGIAQIQNSRIIDFNERTGLNYTLEDMYHPKLTRIVFMHYASGFRANDIERISRCWNGGNKGMEKKSTKEYYLKVKAKL